MKPIWQGGILAAAVAATTLGYAIQTTSAAQAGQTTSPGTVTKDAAQSGRKNPPAAVSTASPNAPQQGQAASEPAHGAEEAGQAAQRRQVIGFADHRDVPKEVAERGKAVYSVNCSFCHGSDAGGGAVGPNLWRSQVVLEDQDGELIQPIIYGSRAEKGMPRIDLTRAQISDVAGFLHSLRVASRDAANKPPINIVVGDAGTGKGTYDRLCSSCHAEGTLNSYVSQFKDPRAMQQAWILPGGPGRNAFSPPAQSVTGSKVQPPSVTVTQGATAVTGTLDRIDDFYVSLTTADGMKHSFERNGDKPKVELHDPVAAHRAMFRTLQDKDIHDVTAYLVTLK